MRRLGVKKTKKKYECLYFLEGAMPEGGLLAFDKHLNTLTYLQVVGQEIQLRVQQQFNAGESNLLVPLLSDFPNFCPHEKLFSSYYYGDTREKNIAQARTLLNEAESAGTWNEEIRAMRTTLSRVRQKLRDFDIRVHFILETGYMLTICPARITEHEEMAVTQARLYPFEAESQLTSLARDDWAGIFVISCGKDDMQTIRDSLRGSLTALFHLASKWIKSRQAYPEIRDREREILLFMAKGQLSNEEIAEALGLGTKTVGRFVASICQKLQAIDRAQAVLLAQKAGLV